MDEKEALEAFTTLCHKMVELIDSSTARMASLEEKVRELESVKGDIYTQSEAARKTGYSTAAISQWIKDGHILGVPIPGKKSLGVPFSEVKRLLARRQRRAS